MHELKAFRVCSDDEPLVRFTSLSIYLGIIWKSKFCKKKYWRLMCIIFGKGTELTWFWPTYQKIRFTSICICWYLGKILKSLFFHRNCIIFGTDTIGTKIYGNIRRSKHDLCCKVWWPHFFSSIVSSKIYSAHFNQILLEAFVGPALLEKNFDTRGSRPYCPLRPFPFFCVCVLIDRCFQDRLICLVFWVLSFVS